MCPVIQLPTTAVGYVRVQLRRRQIGMSEHFLNRTEVGASLEEVGCEGVPQQVGVHALRVEPGLLGEAAEDQERARPGQRAAAGVQEHLRAVAPVEEGAALCQVAAERLDRRAPDGDDALLVALPDDPDEPPLEVDPGLVEADRFGDTEAGAVQKLDERLVAERTRLRSLRRVDQPLGFAG